MRTKIKWLPLVVCLAGLTTAMVWDEVGGYITTGAPTGCTALPFRVGVDANGFPVLEIKGTNYPGSTNISVANFANQGTTTTVLHGNDAGAAAFGKVALTTDVSGVLPVANGGTGQSTVSAVKTGLGIQAGTATTANDGTVTNTFGAAFSSAPVVVTTPVNSTTPTNTVVSVTTSNFVAKLGTQAVVLNWVAIGVP